MEGNALNRNYGILTEFSWGIIVGFLLAVIICGTIAGIIHINNKNREIKEYVELQQFIEELREDYINRDTSDFLDTVTGVRAAADGASADFERKLDEILQRFRSRNVD